MLDIIGGGGGGGRISCCNFFRKSWLVSLSVVSVVLSDMIVNQEEVPGPLHSTELTEPIVIPEPTKRIMPHVIWTVQHGCQRLGVMSNDTDTVMRLLHFTHTLVCDNLKNL